MTRQKALGVVLGAVAVLFLLSACTGARVAPSLEPGKNALIWPQLPDPPRYAYAGTLVGERDFVPKTNEGKSTGTIIFEIVTGLLFGEPDYLQLERPTSGIVDTTGRILVVDPGLASVIVFDMDPKKPKVIKWERGSDEDDFISPIAIAEDGAGGFFVTDSDLAQIFHLSHDGTPLAPLGKGLLTRPTGIAHDPQSGYIYVSDTGAHRIIVFNHNGEVVDTIGKRGTEDGQLNYPTFITLAHKQLYVADTLNFRVQIFDLDGNGKLTIGQLGIRVGDMTRPKGVAVGRDGRVYVMESYFDHMLIYSPSGEFLLPIGGDGNGLGEFYLPSGVWTDKQGKVYVADMFNGRVCVFKELTVGGTE
ncbi:MAG: 6-bladed beta-propeller [Rhodospirillaceae bacterium]|nr:6-bladed beta-propeller [Rhodospirillales bacterium]